MSSDEVSMYRVSDTVRSTHNEDGGIVLDIQKGRLLRLNHTGSAIFQQVEGGQTELQIIEGISRGFHLSHEVARKDVTGFLQSLEAQGLLCRQSSK
jgi:Coenzyme PQQ synthesis protein D (PqqD)